MQVPLVRLQCGVNSYDWGKLGSTSAAAKYAAATASNNLTIDAHKPYAELWMGTHPKLPSKDVQTGRTLLDLVQDNEALLSSEISQLYEKKLPFLFKVLSIRKALSIQAHPNKKLAAQLRIKDPANYPDDNHKPEMTIAVTPFDGLCGFRPLKEIAHFLQNIPAFSKVLGQDSIRHFCQTIEGHEDSKDPETILENKKALQKIFTVLMQAEKAEIHTATEQLIQNADADAKSFAAGGGPSPSSGPELASLVIRLNQQFPNDIGLLVLFFLNYVKLEIGEGMFLKADDIHAYLSGDIIECMAASDNVVRAGFTPKYQDIDTLTSMLTYSYASPAEQKMDPTPYPYVSLNQSAYSSGSASILYDPPIDEFSVLRTDLRARGAKASFEPIAGPSIIICTRGQGSIKVGPKSEDVNEGAIFFVGAGAECVLESGVDSKENPGYETFRAFCEIKS